MVSISSNAKALHEKMERIFKDQGGDFYPVGTAQTYDGVRLVLRALDKVGPDPQKIAMPWRRSTTSLKR